MTQPGAGVRDRTAIAGIGTTEYSHASGRSELVLAVEAALAALEDAGIAPSEVDGIVSADLDNVHPFTLAETLGADLRHWCTVGLGSGAPAGMVAQAVGAILSGQASTVLLYRALNGRSGKWRYGRGRQADASVGGDGTYDEYFLPYGLVTPGQMFALMAQRHMTEYGTTREQLGHIALAARHHANRNPKAQMHARELTMDQYLGARLISSPLGLFDFCLESDGACAVVIASTERARDCRSTPVLIRAVTQATGPDSRGRGAFASLTRPSITTGPGRVAAESLYSRAGLGPDEIDVAQLYDCFTITVLLQLEEYGFCKPGEGGLFAESGVLEPGGALPINTGGGNLSEGYIHGLNHIVEGVRQLRGESSSPVPGAETCLVTSGIPVPTGALVLRKS